MACGERHGAGASMSFPSLAFDRTLDPAEEVIRYCICGHDFDEDHFEDIDKDDCIKIVCLKAGCDCKDAEEDQGGI